MFAVHNKLSRGKSGPSTHTMYAT